MTSADRWTLDDVLAHPVLRPVVTQLAAETTGMLAGGCPSSAAGVSRDTAVATNGVVLLLRASAPLQPAERPCAVAPVMWHRRRGWQRWWPGPKCHHRHLSLGLVCQRGLAWRAHGPLPPPPVVRLRGCCSASAPPPFLRNCRGFGAAIRAHQVINRVSAALPGNALCVITVRQHSCADPVTSFWLMDSHGSSRVGASFVVHPENQCISGI